MYLHSLVAVSHELAQSYQSAYCLFVADRWCCLDHCLMLTLCYLQLWLLPLPQLLYLLPPDAVRKKKYSVKILYAIID